MFGVGKGKLSAAEKKIADRVARENGAEFAGNPKMPGQGYIYWFTTRNYGSPFNERTARAVAKALKAAGWTR
jgi:hypothetical protein